MLTKRFLWALCGVAVILAALPAQSASIKVTIKNLGFQPAQIEASVGDTIEWVNEDVMVHSATSDGNFDVVAQPHEIASVRITKTGTFDYYCRFHPNMRARIQVQPK